MTPNKTIDLVFFISRRQVSTLLKWLVVLNFVFLAGTWAHHTGFFHFKKPTALLLLAQCNLGKENVAASWYSSMLFLVTGLVAFYCCWADWVKSTNYKGRVLSMGWMVMAGIFMLLSFDEMGSFHEMIGETSLLKSTGSGKRAGWYAFYFVCALVALFMIVFFVYRFRKNKTTLLLTIVGVLFFVSNPIQEKFEIHSWRNAADPSTWKRPVIFLLMEEGSEIFASFFFLFSFLTYAITASSSGRPVGIHFQARLGKAVLLIMALLLLLLALLKLLIHFNAWNFARDDNGIPRNWPPSMLFLITFLAAWGIYRSADKPYRFPSLLLALTALASSLYFGANLYGYYGHGYANGLFGILPYGLFAASLVTCIFLIRAPGNIAMKSCWVLWLTGIFLSVMLSNSTISVIPTFAGYFAACCLIAGLSIGIASRSYLQPASADLIPQEITYFVRGFG